MKRIIPIIFLPALAICMGGCSKTLSKLPDNRAVITTPDQVTQLLTSAYPHATYMAFTEPMSDNAEDREQPLQLPILNRIKLISRLTSFRMQPLSNMILLLPIGIPATKPLL